jgi:alpha-tubulin suppressor-like RCC1 family protein
MNNQNTIVVKNVFAGLLHSILLTSTGIIYGTGFNSYGQLGTVNNLDTNTIVTLSGQNFKALFVSTGGYHTCVLTTTGKLYSFGRNNVRILIY